MRRPSEGPIFRELTGDEMKLVLIDDLTEAFRRELERLLDSTNQFYIGNSYPMARVTGALEIKIFPNEKMPLPVPVYVKFDYGTSIETALDKIRELHGLDVLQAKKLPGGFIMNQPVETRDGDSKI